MKRKAKTFSFFKPQTFKDQQPPLKKIFLQVDKKENGEEKKMNLIPQENDDFNLLHETNQNIGSLNPQNDFNKNPAPHTKEQINIPSFDNNSNIKINAENIEKEKSDFEEIQLNKNSEIIEEWCQLPLDLCCSNMKFQILEEFEILKL